MSETADSPWARLEQATDAGRSDVAGRPAAGDRIRPVLDARVTAALALGALVVVATAVRALGASLAPVPAIFPDELIYSDLARGLAESLRFTVRDESFPVLTYGPLYPALLAPAYAVFDPPQAYAVAKIANALLISSTVVPAYLLSRSFLERRKAFVFAALVLLTPGFAYSSRIMTESLFFPVFMLCALMMFRALVLPSNSRQASLLATLLLAFLARGQGIVLYPAYLLAVLVYVSVTRPAGTSSVSGYLRALRSYALSVAPAAAGIFAAAFLQISGIASPLAALGAHARVLRRLDPLAAPKWGLYHVAELDLSLGVAPFAAFVLLAVTVLRPRQIERTHAAFVAVTAALSLTLLAMVALYATQSDVQRIQERYVVYLFPLYVLAVLVWSEKRPQAGPRAAILVTAVAALPLVLPFSRLLNYHAFASTPGLVPWVVLRDGLGRLTPYVVLAVSLLMAFALLRYRLTPLLPLIMASYLGLVSLFVAVSYIELSRSARVWGLGNAASSWIDRAVGRDANVAVLWAGSRAERRRQRTIYENEIFSRSVRRVYVVRGALPYTLPTTRVRAVGGRLLLPSGSNLRAEYVLADARVPVVGAALAFNGSTGQTLYRVGGPVRIRAER